MAGIPKSPRAAFLAWCQSHAPIFTSSSTAIGISAGQATGFSDATDTLAAALAQQQTSADAYHADTAAVEAALRALRTAAGDAVRSIRAYAELQADPETVYSTAKIDPPQPPSPVPAPGTPYKFLASLLPTGALALTWKCDTPAGAGGTTYEIKRRLAGAAGFTFLATTGERKYTDLGIPSGSASATYQVTAVRSTHRGDPAQVNVNFGTGGGGSMVIASVSEGTAKLAA